MYTCFTFQIGKESFSLVLKFEDARVNLGQAHANLCTISQTQEGKCITSFPLILFPVFFGPTWQSSEATPSSEIRGHCLSVQGTM